MAQITTAKSSDLIEAMTTYIEDLELEKRLIKVEEDDDDTYDSDYVGPGQKGLMIPIPKGVPLVHPEDEEEMEGDTVEFRDLTHSIHPKHFKNILTRRKWTTQDINILLDIYNIFDLMGHNNVSIRDVLCAFAPLAAKDDEELLLTCCQIFDLEDTKTVGFGVLLHIFQLVMTGISFFGDRVLERVQIIDVVNSVFTLAGKPEGFVYYENYFNTIMGHPIVVLFKSEQYQGIARDKYHALIEHSRKMRTEPDEEWRGVSLTKPINEDDSDDEDTERPDDLTETRIL